VGRSASPPAAAADRTSVTGVVSTLPLLVERPRRFPAPVEAELELRRMGLVDRARGRVLDLDRPDARAEVAHASTEQHVVPAYDTAVSVGQLVRFPDLVAALRGIDRLVGPDGELLVVEPDARPGLAALFVDSLWARTRWVAGFHVGRDLTGALRSTEFVVDSIERFTMPTVVSSLRCAVEVHAVRLPVPESRDSVPAEAVQ
jgi:hypothetical protein